MGRRAFRPLLTCLTCGYAWHPRGKNYSRKCPGCGVMLAPEPSDGVDWRPREEVSPQAALLLFGLLIVFLLALASNC